MDNLVNYKLSQYVKIRALNEEETAILCYNTYDDNTYVIKYTDIIKKNIYEKIKGVKCNNLPEIYDMIEDGNKYVIIEKYIKGTSIERLVKEKNRLDEKTACKYILDICRALKVIHGLNIIHRDISPDNVIIDENDNAVLLDFDIAREGSKNRTTDTTILGTAGFASPEQYGFAQTDSRSDIYSLGVLFNYMLTGHIVQNGIYENKKIAAVIKKSTAIERSQRYSSIDELIADISFSAKKETKHSKFYNELHEFIITVPGFRTHNIIKSMIAILVYLYTTALIVNTVKKTTSIINLICSLYSYWVIFILPMWWFGNNGKEWDIVPMFKNLEFKTKRTAAIMSYIIFLFISAFTINLII